MSNSIRTTWHTNPGSHQITCQHCGGTDCHHHWCITVNPVVYYAYQIIADPWRLSAGDALILHSLGVAWTAEAASAKGKQ